MKSTDSISFIVEYNLLNCCAYEVGISVQESNLLSGGHSMQTGITPLLYIAMCLYCELPVCIVTPIPSLVS